MAKLIETKIAEMLDGGEPLAWAIRKDGRMKVIAHDGREYWFEAREVEAARRAIERGEAPNPNPGTAPDKEPGTAPVTNPKPGTAARRSSSKSKSRRSSSKK